MRTQQEIIERYNQRKAGDMLGFESDQYLSYLDYEHVKPYLKKGAAKEEWVFLSLREITNRMKAYMSFAWDKANNCRGISANRSIQHYIAWIWLSGNDEFAEKIDQAFENNYHHYGKPILEQICNHYGWD